MQLRVQITGDRNWTNWAIMLQVIGQLPPGSIVIHGDARGADRMAGAAAKHFGLAVEVYPAQWDKYGRRAGPLRNIQMLDTNPHFVLAFHDDLASSKGTKHMVKEALGRGLKVRLYTYADDQRKDSDNA